MKEPDANTGTNYTKNISLVHSPRNAFLSNRPGYWRKPFMPEEGGFSQAIYFHVYSRTSLVYVGKEV